MRRDLLIPREADEPLDVSCLSGPGLIGLFVFKLGAIFVVGFLRS